MNIEICKNCKNFKVLIERYRCSKFITEIKHRHTSFKMKYPENFSGLNAFLRHKVPKDCPYKLENRNEKQCLNCKFCKKEEIRVKCSQIINSWSYINFYKKWKIEEEDNCLYEFEQKMSELNE